MSVAILTDEQAAVHFGADLGKNDLQALWLSVRNGSPHPLRFIRNTLDRDFYSADEAAIILKDEVSSRESDVLR